MSCLFDSLSTFVPDSSAEIREKVCKYLRESKPLIEGIDTQLLADEAYVRRMQMSSTWGGGIEIRAFANLYHRKVVLTSTRGQDRDTTKPIIFDCDGISTGACFLSWSGTHYIAGKPFILL